MTTSLDPNDARQPGEIVVCRLTKRVGKVIRVLPKDGHGREYYVRWEGRSPDFSLMSREELLPRESPPAG
jgi:hypothetical protein